MATHLRRAICRGPMTCGTVTNRGPLIPGDNYYLCSIYRGVLNYNRSDELRLDGLAFTGERRAVCRLSMFATTTLGDARIVSQAAASAVREPHRSAPQGIVRLFPGSRVQPREGGIQVGDRPRLPSELLQTL